MGVSIFAYDVTEQVRARQQREIQQLQLAELFEQAPVAIAILRGEKYVIEVANPPMAELWGRTPAEVLGRPLLDALPEVRGQGFQELLDGVVTSGEAFVAQEVPTRLPRGGELATVYVNFVYHPLRDERGNVSSIGAVAIDVTEQVRARQAVASVNDRLTATNEQLTRTNVDLDNFIYTASHDLRAPIINIEGLLALLQDEWPAESRVGDVPYIMGLMHGAVERFKDTIDQLTDLTKLQRAHAEPATDVPLAPMVAAVELDLQPLITQTGGRVQVDVAACPSVSFSPKNLRSVVYNLLSNALKYHHPDRPPLVRLTSHAENGYTVLAVHDNGLGLAPEQQPELFNLFRRLHTHVEGSGVGLYMVKRIVENAGGKVTVRSEPGVGSSFSVHLPR
ncbi:MAG: PAS domain-containing sensor histidine kinase [Hymenobacteraceae bacterium]|nr:PAS domain-containing sensor histidine kinase [Hymenobacteraceae bacterium]